MPRHELARLKLMRQPMRSRVAQIVQPCEKSGLGADVAEYSRIECGPDLLYTDDGHPHFSM
jgi:hypothetical protein